MYPPSIGVDIDSCGEFQTNENATRERFHHPVSAFDVVQDIADRCADREREACAKIAEKLEHIQAATTWKGFAPPIAKAIRDRGKTTRQ